MNIPDYLRPLHSNLLVRIDPPRERKGLIYVPEASQGEAGTGTVVAIGPGRIDPVTGEREEMEIRVGDRVAYEIFRAIEKLEEETPDIDPDHIQRTFELEDDDRKVVRYTLIQQRHVLGVLEDAPKGAEIEVRA